MPVLIDDGQNSNLKNAEGPSLLKSKLAEEGERAPDDPGIVDQELLQGGPEALAEPRA